MKLLYYLILKPLSLLPFPIIYFISDLLAFVLNKIVGYRKQVIIENLQLSFPEKSDSEINTIVLKFYTHLADIIMESVKSFSITKKELQERVVAKNPEIIYQFTKKNLHVVGIASHCGNWEWAGMYFNHITKYKTMGVYKPLSNQFFDNKLKSTRGKFGLEMIAMKEVKQYFKNNINQPFCSAFAADQSPGNSNKSVWLPFLNRETAVTYGPEKFAREYNYPTIFGYLRKIKRGYYEIEFETITEIPLDTKQYYITKKHTEFTEKLIKETPEYWLWSHKRWKHTRIVNSE